jgi:hypothetical protein
MSASSINRQVAEIEKAKKVERRKALMKEVAPVIEEKPEEPSIVNVVDSGEITAKPAFLKKSAPKKKSKK